MVSISYQSKTKIIYALFEGKIYLKHLINLIDSLDKNFKDQKKVKIILDYRKAKLSFIENLIAVEIFQIRDYVSSKMQNYTKVDQAVVVDDLNNKTINTFYMKASTSIENYTFKIFNDIEAAENWLVNS